MMKKLYTITLALLFGAGAISQTTDLGGPMGWHPKFVQPKNVDSHAMPGFDAAAVAYEDSINDLTKAGPWRFGYKYNTNFSLENSGTWTNLNNGNRLWQIELICNGALTVNLIFENLQIPEGAYIYLYDVNKTNRVGAYTSRNNNSENMLGTELVHGDHIIVEYFEPAAVAGQGTLTIANVVHGYRSLSKVQESLLKDLEDSGNCNVDVNCPLGDGWENEIRSVAMIVVSGNGICTGALINNTCDDGTPYFLTANHCVDGANLSTWAFRFNWDSPVAICQTAGTSTDPGAPYDQTANGATELYASPASDVALLQITNMTLTDAQNWNCYYAGWDNTDGPVSQGTGIHHPSGDVKKICREDNALSQTSWGGAACWQIANWDQGVTEPGSSGSPLFDQNHRIIGQLYGGSAACSGTNDNNQPDYYGRFGVSWPNIDTWLAPGGCGSPTTNDGWDPVSPPTNDDAGINGISTPSGNFCTDTFDPVVTLRNYGANNLTQVTINYDIDGGTNNTYSWTGTLAPGATTNVTLPTMTTTAGAHTFNAYTSNPNAVVDTNPANDDASSSYNATIGGEAVTLTIDTDCWGYEFAWQILDGSSNVIQEGGNLSVIPGGGQIANTGDPGSYGDETTVTETFCLAVGCYDLVVYDDWGDGFDGTGSGCAIDGNYELTNSSATVLAAMSTPDYGATETTNFCIASPCAGSVNNTTTEEICFDDCDGTITVNASGGTLPYSYDIGSGPQGSNIFSSLCQGTYNISVLDGDGCSQVISVTLNGPSEITGSTVVTDESLGNDGAINLTAAGGTGTLDYAWTGPGGFTASTQDISGLAAGTYSVTITDDNNCSIVISGIIVDSEVGISENGFNNLMIYPNPSTGIFTLDFGQFVSGETFISVRDITGRIIFTYQLTDDNMTQIDLASFADGTYYVQIVSGENTKVIAVVKKN
ncbi:MAG: T9SS type A sorting domain-containing protein [Crocinitomicaceae bacterium]|nr:T9SS type A sorting domain-containing protein [Crocinitomicaceae bacterium]MBK8926335.1 T9SS type A sorting domain-containing protein [Crocinitomicaceae bacterium]